MEFKLGDKVCINFDEVFKDHSSRVDYSTSYWREDEVYVVQFFEERDNPASNRISVQNSKGEANGWMANYFYLMGTTPAHSLAREERLIKKEIWNSSK